MEFEKANWALVEEEVEDSLDRQWLSTVKKQLKRDMEPFGHDFEAVVTFKQYCDKKDSFLPLQNQQPQRKPEQTFVCL